MTLLTSDGPDFEIDDGLKAIYGGAKAFNYDYEEYAESLFPGDLDMQDDFLMNSKEYYEYLEAKLINEKSGASFVCDSFSSKIISYLSFLK